MKAHQYYPAIFLAAIWGGITAGSLATIERELKAMSEEKEVTEEVKSSDGLWVMTLPEHAPPDATKQGREMLEQIVLGKAEMGVLPEGYKLEHMQANKPYFTWSHEGPQPPRKERRDDDPQYPVIRVHNSHSPMFKQGRLVRPITPIDAELAIWEVDVGGKLIVVHDPEEAWQ